MPVPVLGMANGLGLVGTLSSKRDAWWVKSARFLAREENADTMVESLTNDGDWDYRLLYLRK